MQFISNDRVMPKFIFTAVLALIGLQAWAIEVTNQAGSLSGRIGNHDITSLTIKGTLDARDFKFIADNLNKLEDIDLSQATIIAYGNNETPLFALTLNYEAHTIPCYSFFGMKLKSMKLPSNLKAIGSGAFAGCSNLNNIVLPATVDSIAPYAFNATGLTSIALPASVKIAGDGAFAHCPNLANATVPNATLGDDCFMGDSRLTTLTLGSGVTKLGNGALKACTALSTIEFTGKMSITSIGNEALLGCGITNLDFTPLQQLGSIGNWALAMNSDLQQVKLPTTIKHVGDGAFYYNSQLSQLNLPSSLNHMSAYMLAGCEAMTSDNIVPKGMTIIDDYALYNWNRCPSIVIPSTITHIGTQAMAGMTALTGIKALPTIVPTLGSEVWAGIDPQKVVLDVPQSSVAPLYAQALQWKDFALRVAYMPGDVNEDGIVDVNDATTLTDKILGGSPSPFNAVNADIDKNGIFDAGDVANAIDIMLQGKGNTSPTTQATTDKLTLADIGIKPEETQDIEIKLNNKQSYVTLQFDLVMPQGLEIVSGEIVPAERVEQHTFAHRLQADGNTTRIVGYSTQGATITGHEGALLKLKVKAGATLATQSPISIANVLFITPELNRMEAQGTTAQVNNVGGVDNLTAHYTQVWVQQGVLIIKSNSQATAQLVAMNGTSHHLDVKAGINEYSDLGTGFYVVRVNGESFKVAIP